MRAARAKTETDTLTIMSFLSIFSICYDENQNTLKSMKILQYSVMLLMLEINNYNRFTMLKKRPF